VTSSSHERRRLSSVETFTISHCYIQCYGYTPTQRRSGFEMDEFCARPNAAGERRPTLGDAEEAAKSLRGGPSAPVDCSALLLCTDPSPLPDTSLQEEISDTFDPVSLVSISELL